MINNLNVQKNECNCNIENGKKIMEMLETERKRIVSELHDTSLQDIAHFVHMIELASLYIDKDPARAKMELNSVSKGLHNVIEDIRSTIFNLRPMTFDDLGIDESIVGLAGSPTKVHATFTKEVSAETETFDLPSAEAAKLIAKTLKDKQIITK